MHGSSHNFVIWKQFMLYLCCTIKKITLVATVQWSVDITIVHHVLSLVRKRRRYIFELCKSKMNMTLYTREKVFSSMNGVAVSIDIQETTNPRGDVVTEYGMNGELLVREHGAPI